MKQIGIHHDILRSRYTVEGSEWTQTIIHPSHFTFPKPVIENVTTLEEMESIINDLQQSHSITEGRLYNWALIQYNDEQRLFISVHHLAIDLVSWRIIAEDLELLLNDKSLPHKTTSFKEWSEQLSEEFGNSSANWKQHETPVFNILQSRSLPLEPSPTSNSFTVSLPEEFTNQLDMANISFRTNVQELVLASLVQSLSSLQGQNDSIRIHLEGHGREPWNDSLDITRTVGWFTSLFPVVLPVHEIDIKKQLKSVKQIIRSIPQNGITYGLQETKEFQNETNIVFNYLGRFQSFEGSKAFFNEDQIVKRFEVDPNMITEENAVITAYHENKKLFIRMQYDDNLDVK
ncbi:condensation domain-containing protein, partial [Globomyces pollinis-pini]